MSDRTVRLHRVIRTTPALLFKAFTNPDAMAKWLPPHGYTCQVQQMNPTVGGEFRMSFTHFASGQSHHFGGRYLEIEPNARLRYTDVFDDPNLPGEMITTVTFNAVSCGTELNVTQAGIPTAIPLEGCYLGWQESLSLLALLVEAPVPCN